MAALMAHDWPGNVRELRNVLERAVLLQRSGALTASSLMLAHTTRTAAPAQGGSTEPQGAVSLDAVEREHLLRALTQCKWNVTQSAKLLGISRDTLRYRIERHGLQR